MRGRAHLRSWIPWTLLALMLALASIVLPSLVGARRSEPAEAHDLAIRPLCLERLPVLARPAERDELFFAMVRAGDAEAVTTLLDCGVSIDASDRSGRTALHLASYHGHAALVDALLAHGAPPDPRDDLGLTPLMNASFRGEDAIVRALVAHGARVDATNLAGQTAVMFAAAFGRTSTVSLLVAHGADVRRTDALGLSAELLARASRPAKLVERFVRAAVREARVLAGRF